MDSRRRRILRRALERAARRVDVYPDERQGGHIPGGHCPCRPRLETWRFGEATSERLVHRGTVAVDALTPGS